MVSPTGAGWSKFGASELSEEVLRFEHIILRTQQEASPDAILVVDNQGTFISYNQRFVELWRIPNSIIESRSDEEALEYVRNQLTDPVAFLDRVHDLYQRPEARSFDELTLKDGRVLDRYSAPMIGADGRHYGRVWFFREVTDRVEAERAVRENEERLATILESAMDAIVTVDSERRVRLFNQAAEETFGCSRAEVIGKTFEPFLSDEFQKILRIGIRELSGGSQDAKGFLVAPRELFAFRKSGEPFPVESTLSRAELGGEHLYTMILRDVDDRKRAQQDIRRLKALNQYLRVETGQDLGFGEIVGASPPMRRVLEQVEQVAGTDATTLLTGETGTGKELVARAIHDQSRRADKVLVKVNCAALPSTLIESEFFGHEEGAFTGANKQKLGRFEVADGGTIFLDEIGDLPLELQAKILRVLQEGEFERLGGTEVVKVDVRVIAATNKELHEEVQAQRFRADLFYRLNVFPIELPPLRNRPEDLAPLTRHFVAKYGAKLGRPLLKVPSEVIDTLARYPWPGNVRELQNVIERAVILCQGDTLEVAPISESVREAGAEIRLEDVERSHILKILERTRWKVSGEGGAAHILGLKPTTLSSRMKKLGLERP